jgi:hypothetical protein
MAVYHAQHFVCIEAEPALFCPHVAVILRLGTYISGGSYWQKQHTILRQYKCG